MIHISIDYTGIIPGLGRGPFTNIAISNTLYARLKAIGYPVKVLSSNRIIKNTVVRKPINLNEGVKPKSVSTAKVEVPVAKPAAPVAQPVVAKIATPVIEKGIAKVDVDVVMPAPVDSIPLTIEVKKTEEPEINTCGYCEVVEEKVEEAPVEEVPAEVEEKKIDVSSLDEMTKEELDEMLKEYTTERPGRYGKPWLIKTLKSYLNS